MKSTSSIFKIYGPIPPSCERALQKVSSLIGLDHPAHLIWDDGTNIGRIHALSAFLGYCKSADWEKSPNVCKYSQFLNAPSFLDTEKIIPLDMPFNLTQLITAASTPNIKSNNRLLEEIEDALNDELILYRKSTLGKEAHNKPAAKYLWNGKTDLIEKEKPLRPLALLVDDRMDQPTESGHIDLIKVAGRLSEMGFAVKGCLNIPESGEKEHLWEFDISTNTFLKSGNINLHEINNNVDIIFLDIVKMPSPTDKNYDTGMMLEGIHRNLKILCQERSFLPYPQIYMLSHMGRELVAHLCLSHGADYYLEKREFLLDAPRILPEILHNTTKLQSLANISEIEGLYLDDGDINKWGWTTECLFPGEKESAELEKRIRNLCKYTYLLYSQNYHIKSIKLIKKFYGRFSGPAVLHVRPEDDLGNQRDRVVKIANKHVMSAELKAFSRYIEPYALRGFARVESNKLILGEEGIISYDFIGSSGYPQISRSQIMGLDEAFIQKSRSSLNNLLEMLYSRLSRIHSGRHEDQSEWEIWKYFRRELGAFSLSGWDGEKNSGEYEFEILQIKRSGYSDKKKALIGLCENGIWKPSILRTWIINNPESLGPDFLIRPGKKFKSKLPSKDDSPFLSTITTIAKVVEKERSQEGKSIDNIRKKSRDYLCKLDLDVKLKSLAEKATAVSDNNEPWGIVHGDLHMLNIFVDISDVWIIDYGKTRKGPPAIDYVALEYDVRHRFLFPLLSQKAVDKINDSEKWLDTVSSYIEGFENSINSEDMCSEWLRTLRPEPMQKEILTKAVSAIRKIRDIAFQGIYKDNKRGYFLVLFLYCIRVLQNYYSEASNPNGPIGTIWAACLADRIHEKFFKS